MGGPAADGHTIAGRYAIERQLGSGGMGRVYEASDLLLGRRVAVKVLMGLADPAQQQRFLREARALALIRSPNTVIVHDIVVEDGVPHLVMELLQGVDLARLLNIRRTLPHALVRAVASGVCSGLSAAHDAGLLHRDVKPSNIHLTREGQVVLQDFGIAHIRDTAQTHLTATGMAVGTPVYMSPEVISGDRAGSYSDLYALGACMYEMLAGKRPFEGDSAVTVLFRVVQQEAPSLRGTPGVPDDLADLVARLLAKDPALRPVADEVQTLLRCPPNAAELVAEAATGNLREQAVRDFVPEPVRRVSLDPPGSDAPGSLDISGPPAIEPGDPQSAPADSEGVTQDNRRSHPVGELGLSDATLTRIRRGISPEMAEARQREAVSLLLRGSLGEAVELLTMVAEVCRASFGPGHPTTLACHYWQGVCLARLGAGPEAVAKFADVTAGVTAVLTERD